MKKKLFEYIDEDKKTTLVFDGHNLIYRCLYSAYKQYPLDENFIYYKQLIVMCLISTIKKFKPNKCIVALDSMKNWRKDVYKQYKENRKIDRDKSNIDFKKFFEINNKFFDDLKKTFSNIYFIEVDYCEADDIICIITKEILHNQKIIAITNDHDLYQLKKYKNYNQYDPLKKKFIEHINPKKELLIKILTGDKSDNIPSIKERMGPKTASKFLDDLDLLFSDNTKIKNNYLRNKKLIDLNCVPNKHVKSIKEAYYRYGIKEYRPMSAFNFFIRNKCNYFVDNISVYSRLLKCLS